MNTVPFGVSRLDSLVDGGAPQGSVVLLASESGAGGREFLYTSAVMNTIARIDEELFELHYGELAGDATPPPEVHYVSFTADEAYLTRQMGFTMDPELVDRAAEQIRFADLSREYFHPSPVPREWYLGETSALRDLGTRQEHDDVLEAFGTYLSEHATDSLVVIDSVTDLVAAVSDETTWSDIALVLKGLSKAAHQWGGLILLLVNRETLEDGELGLLKDAVDGTFCFEWESGGSKRARTMVVQEFRGVLSRLEDENIVQFETEIHDGGFDISDIRKIR
ncbi:HTR-like protein [Salinigranum marinum]|uniref:RAD55 family ATPase n=1 Tax=Salinigranum marinum TaxID=1515595 RepID=UPI002989C60B|nr:HTR-like protein [Salinigranum marinum]